MRFFRTSLLSLAAISFAVVSTSAFASDIDFSTVTTTSALTTYTEYGYTVTNDGGNWFQNKNQGNPPPGVSGGTGSGTLLIEQVGNGSFQFFGFDLGTLESSVSYTITGYSAINAGGSVVYTETGTDSTFNASPPPLYTTYDTSSGDAGDAIESLTIALNAPSNFYYADNFQVSTNLTSQLGAPTPEPSSLLLLGTGLLGLAGAARRRFAH